MFLLNVKASYDSAHFLRNYKGKCENLHGHHYVVEAGLAYEDVGPGGMAMDFTDAKRVLRAASVFGEVFWDGGVEALLGDSGVYDVREWLARRGL